MKSHKKSVCGGEIKIDGLLKFNHTNTLKTAVVVKLVNYNGITIERGWWKVSSR